MFGFQRFVRYVLYGKGSGQGPCFSVGVLVGVFATYLFLGRNYPQQKSTNNDSFFSTPANNPPKAGQQTLPVFLPHFPQDLSAATQPIYPRRHRKVKEVAPVSYGTSSKTLAGQAEDLLAKSEDIAGVLAREIRVLCMVLTTQQYHEERAVFVKHTWGSRCTKLIFLSDIDDAELPSIKASQLSDYNHVWSKIRGGFLWAYKNHITDFDWFMKADDDTYFIMENLRALLVEFNPDDAVFVGHEFGNEEWVGPSSYYSGGAGYVLSRQAVVRLVEDAMPMPKYCSPGKADVSEDVEMGRCLESIGIKTRDTRDDIGRQRFLPLPPTDHLLVGRSPPDFWIWSYEKAPYKEGVECCSSLAISFHYITNVDMIQFEYLIHRVHLFGRNLFGESDVAAGVKLAFRLINEKLIANYNSSADEDAVPHPKDLDYTKNVDKYHEWRLSSVGKQNDSEVATEAEMSRELPKKNVHTATNATGSGVTVINPEHTGGTVKTFA